MQAPHYGPAERYAPPRLMPYVPGSRRCSVEELHRDPVAWAIVVKHMPSAAFLVQVPAVQAQLGNMTLGDFVVFTGTDNTPALDAMDLELARLPVVGA